MVRIFGIDCCADIGRVRFHLALIEIEKDRDMKVAKETPQPFVVTLLSIEIGKENRT